MAVTQQPLRIGSHTIQIPTLARIAESRKALVESRAWIQAELIVVTLLVQVGIWNLGPTRSAAVKFGIAWIILTTLLDGITQKEMGLSWKASKQAYWLAYPALFLIALVWVVGVLCGTQDQFSHQPGTILNHKFGYILGAVAQQLLMQSYVFVRLQKLWPQAAVKYTAASFSLSHLPNPVLIVLCWGVGWVTATQFKKYRCVWALGIAHGVIGAAMAEYLPSWVMRVGKGLLTLGSR
jgi:hypothetical protein